MHLSSSYQRNTQVFDKNMLYSWKNTAYFQLFVFFIFFIYEGLTAASLDYFILLTYFFTILLLNISSTTEKGDKLLRRLKDKNYHYGLQISHRPLRYPFDQSDIELKTNQIILNVIKNNLKIIRTSTM